MLKHTQRGRWRLSARMKFAASLAALLLSSNMHFAAGADCFPPDQQKLPSILASKTSDISSRYTAVSGNADFIVAGGYLEPGFLNFSQDAS